jgi:hypothetical protein
MSFSVPHRTGIEFWRVQICLKSKNQGLCLTRKFEFGKSWRSLALGDDAGREMLLLHPRWDGEADIWEARLNISKDSGSQSCQTIINFNYSEYNFNCSSVQLPSTGQQQVFRAGLRYVDPPHELTIDRYLEDFAV